MSESDRAEMLEVGRDVRRRAIGLLARLPIHSDAYKAVSSVLDAANQLLVLLEAEDWRGRNSIRGKG